MNTQGTHFRTEKTQHEMAPYSLSSVVQVYGSPEVLIESTLFKPFLSFAIATKLKALVCQPV